MAEAESFAEWVRRARKALDLSQRELALQVGCAVVTIQKIEEGRRRPSRETAGLLCDRLEIATEDRARFLRAARASGTSSNGKAAASPPGLPAGFPTPAAPFIGRAHDLGAIGRLIQDPNVRVITLVGPPGVGKTRLSVEAAVRTSGFRDGAWFVPLAPLQDPRLVITAAGHVLGFSNANLEQLTALLRGRSMLIVLDNCEHLLEAVPEIAVLVSRCAGVKLLATSRAPLRIYGENVYPVGPLLLPGSARSPESDAVALFVARAAAVSPGLALTDRTLEQIVDLCEELGGLPLAIELAAAGLYHQTLDQLAGAILCCDDPLAALAHAPRDFDNRHQSLANALAWSYNLLSEPAQRVYRSLSAFRGRITSRAAHAAAGEDGVLSTDGALTELVQHSLLTRHDGERFAMLEVVRADAQARCRAASELAEVRERHAGWFLERMSAIDWSDAGLDLGLIEARADADNLRAALEWLTGAGDAARSLQMCTALRRFWEYEGYQREGQAWLGRALALQGDTEPLLRARAYLDGSVLAFQTGDYATAEEWGEECLRLYSEAGRLGDAALATLTLGRTALEQGCYDIAEKREEEALVLYRSAGDEQGEAGALMHQSEVALGRGEDAAACELAELSLALTAPDGGTFWDALTHLVLFEVDLRARRLGDARNHLLASIEASTTFHAIRPLTLALAMSAALAAHLPGDARDNARLAARLWGTAIELRLSRGLTFSAGHRQRLDGYLSGARALLGPQEWQREEQHSRHLSLEAAVAVAQASLSVRS